MNKPLLTRYLVISSVFLSLPVLAFLLAIIFGAQKNPSAYVNSCYEAYKYNALGVILCDTMLFLKQGWYFIVVSVIRPINGAFIFVYLPFSTFVTAVAYSFERKQIKEKIMLKMNSRYIHIREAYMYLSTITLYLLLLQIGVYIFALLVFLGIYSCPSCPF